MELLKVLLRCEAERLGVASKLLATVSDLEEIAASDAAEVSALKGWRREAFGEKALRLKRGEIGLVMKGKRVLIFDVAAGEIISGGGGTDNAQRLGQEHPPAQQG